MEETCEKAEIIAVLRQIVLWWEKWKNSDNPTKLEDPPIQDAKEILIKHGFYYE